VSCQRTVRKATVFRRARAARVGERSTAQSSWMGRHRKAAPLMSQAVVALAALRLGALAQTPPWQQEAQARVVQRDRTLRLLMRLPLMPPEPAARTRTVQRNSHSAWAIDARSAPATTIASAAPVLPARRAAFALAARRARTAKEQPRPAIRRPINAWVARSGATVRARAKPARLACALR